MLKSCDREFCGRNKWLEGEEKEAVSRNISLRIVIVDLENSRKDVPVVKKSGGTLDLVVIVKPLKSICHNLNQLRRKAMSILRNILQKLKMVANCVLTMLLVFGNDTCALVNCM